MTFNLALGRPAQQSSTIFGGKATWAVDGNKGGLYGIDLSCTHTLAGTNNWWLVDLQTLAVIYDVRIANRADGLGRFTLMHT